MWILTERYSDDNDLFVVDIWDVIALIPLPPMVESLYGRPIFIQCSLKLISYNVKTNYI